MKKIIFSFGMVLFFTGIVLGQENRNTVPVNSELMINGKPYSQYKAEQDLLKQQKAAAAAAARVAVVQPAAAISTMDIPTAAQQQKMQVQPATIVKKEVTPTAAINNWGNGNANPNQASVKIDAEKAVLPAAPRTTAENGGAIVPVAEGKIVGIPEVRKPVAKTEAAVTLPAIQVTSESVQPESKTTEAKVQPVTPNNPNAPKTKTD